MGFALTAVLLCAFGQEKLEKEPPRAEESEHFKAISSLPVAGAILEAAEAAWKPALALYGVESPHLQAKLEFCLDADTAQYRAAESKLTGGAFRDNLAFTHAGTKTAHVCLQPRCTEAVLHKIGLPNMTRRLIAHEATHLIGYAAIANYDRLPGWLTDGIASCVDDQVMNEAKLSAGSEKDPLTSTYVVLAQRLLKEKKLPTVESILLDEARIEPASARYGVRWLLARFLSQGKRSRSFHSLVQKIIAMKSDADRRGTITAATEELFGDLKQLNIEFQRFVKALNPTWDEVLRSLSTTGKDWVQIAFPDNNALAWRLKHPASGEYEIAGQLTILANDGPQMNILLGRSEHGFISVALVAGYGVTVFEYESKVDRWNRLGSVEVKAVTAGRPIDFRVQIKGGRLEVFIGKKSAVKVSLGERSMTGEWGLGAQARSAGIWSNVALAEKKPAKGATSRPSSSKPAP